MIIHLRPCGRVARGPLRARHSATRPRMDGRPILIICSAEKVENMLSLDATVRGISAPFAQMGYHMAFHGLLRRIPSYMETWANTAGTHRIGS